MPSSPESGQRRLPRALALLPAVGTVCAAFAATPSEIQRLHLSCTIFYTPQRTHWQRELEISHDGRQVLSLRIDGQSPYTHSLRGRVLLTAVDNERIRVDLERGQWESDFRGQATGEGLCRPLN